MKSSLKFFFSGLSEVLELQKQREIIAKIDETALLARTAHNNVTNSRSKCSFSRCLWWDFRCDEYWADSAGRAVIYTWLWEEVFWTAKHEGRTFSWGCSQRSEGKQINTSVSRVGLYFTSEFKLFTVLCTLHQEAQSNTSWGLPGSGECCHPDAEQSLGKRRKPQQNVMYGGV